MEDTPTYSSKRSPEEIIKTVLSQHYDDNLESGTAKEKITEDIISELAKYDYLIMPKEFLFGVRATLDDSIRILNEMREHNKRVLTKLREEQQQKEGIDL